MEQPLRRFVQVEFPFRYTKVTELLSRSSVNSNT